MTFFIGRKPDSEMERKRNRAEHCGPGESKNIIKRNDFMNLADVKAYEVLKEKKVAELNSTAHLLEHKKSGARLFLLSNDDENKVFSPAPQRDP